MYGERSCTVNRGGPCFAQCQTCPSLARGFMGFMTSAAFIFLRVIGAQWCGLCAGLDCRHRHAVPHHRRGFGTGRIYPLSDRDGVFRLRCGDLYPVQNLRSGGLGAFVDTGHVFRLLGCHSRRRVCGERTRWWWRSSCRWPFPKMPRRRLKRRSETRVNLCVDCVF